MPTAGAIIPPLILPLRKPLPGVPGNHIDTTTFIELETESHDCKIYFTTDGTKPNPFQLKVGGREITFKYRGPFTLKPGKRTVKSMAVTRDGFQESNVVTKTFQVENAGVPSECENNDDLIDSMFESESVNSYRPTRSKSQPLRTSSVKTKKRPGSRKKLKEAWATTTSDYVKPTTVPSDLQETVGNNSNSVSLPDGCAPTNYSGTQINFWGCAPNLDPGKWAQQANQANSGLAPYGNPYASQLGGMTNQMISGLGGPKISMDELKRLYANQNQPEYKDPPLRAVSEGCDFDEKPINSDPVPQPRSKGNGDWKDQLRHIHAHLIEECKNDVELRTLLGAPKMGKLIQADFDADSNAYVLTLSFAKPGKPARKALPAPKAQPKVEPPPRVEPPKPKPVKPAPKVQKSEKPKPKPEPKVEPKPKPKPEPAKQEDPYFVTEEYENERKKKKVPTATLR